MAGIFGQGGLLGAIMTLSQIRNMQESQQLNRDQYRSGQRDKALDLIGKLPESARGAAIDYFRGVLRPEDIPTLTAHAGQLPQDPVTLRAGYISDADKAMDPEEKGRIGKEALYGAVAGQTSGGAAQSMTTADMLGGGTAWNNFSKGAQDVWQHGIVERLSTGQDVGSAAVSRALANTSGLPQYQAEVQAGARATQPFLMSHELGKTQGAANLALGLSQFDLSKTEADYRAKLAQTKYSAEQQMDAHKQATGIIELMTTRDMKGEGLKFNAIMLNQYLEILGLDKWKIDPTNPADWPRKSGGLAGYFMGSGSGSVRPPAAPISVPPPPGAHPGYRP